MPGNPAPDWYPDPEDPAIVRWWDGARWSGETRPAAEAATRPAQPPGSPAIPGHADPAPFGGIENPASPVTGPGGPPFPADGGGEAGLQASWREPALESWAAVYRSAGPAAGQGTFPARRWVLGGAAVMVAAAVAAWLLAGVLAGRGGHATSPPAFRGGVVTDRAAGISFTIPGGAGWAKVARPGDGFTTMYRRPAPAARPGGAREWAVAAAAPLPAAIGYRGAPDLRPDAIRAAHAVAKRYFPWYYGRLHADVRRATRSAAGPACVVTFRVAGRGGTAGQTAAVVIVGRGRGRRPGLLFVTVPDTMSTRLAGQIAGTARPVT